MHHARAVTAVGVALGTGGRIAGIPVGIHRTRVGIERSGSGGTGAVVSRGGGGNCGCGDCGGGARRFLGGIATAAGAGHRTHQNGGQGQRGESPRRCPLDALNGFHSMTVPFGQRRLPCLFFAKPPRGHPVRRFPGRRVTDLRRLCGSRRGRDPYK